MPRYGINVNYAPSPWANVMPSIGNAIDMYQKKQEADRAEENQIAAQGGVPVGERPTTARDRLSQVGGFIRRRILGRGDGRQDVPDASVLADANGPFGVQVTPSANNNSVVTQMPAVAGVTQAGGARLLGGATPAPAASPRRIGDAILSDPAQTGDPRSASWFGTAPRAPMDERPSIASARPLFDEQPPVVRAGAGTAPQPPMANVAPPAGSISDALKPYTITAGSGQKYQIDPMRGTNLAIAAKRGEVQAEMDIKNADRDKTQREQVQALIDAGMSPAVARAKVLNNVVKYDETYGQQRTGMSSKDRMAVQDRIDARQRDAQAAALRLEQLRQAGRQGTREFQELALKLRAQQQDDANDRALLQADEAAAGRADRTVTTLQTNPVVAATPEGQKAIGAAKDAATAAGAKADSSRARVANKPRASVSAKPTISQQQYDMARAKINPNTKQPYTDAEIAAFYNIAPTVKRK